ncbi:MAG TPA: hypothetical protein VHF47_02095 [Acidimicrobiales bacterium]|nr:hypothetical protein [Acidimicrobiales bacterium]
MPGTDDHGVVRLEAVPVHVFLESQDHQKDLIRELQLIRFGADDADGATADVSRRLARLIGDILARYQSVRSATREQAIAALERGEDFVTLEVPVRPGMADALREWLRLLEEADDLCGHGELLLLASSPEVRRLRRRYADEIIAQLEGQPHRDA